MTKQIEKIAVVGAGTMGARIAAHLANAGIPCFLLDIVPTSLTDLEARKNLTLESRLVRNRIVEAGLDAARKSRPAAFFTPETARMVTPGNLEDDLAWCGQVEWIIEAVAENLEIKRNLLARIESVRKPGTIVTSNTSGLPIHLIAEGRSEDFQEHWAGTHFFNPPRYMKLVELVAGPRTKPGVLASLEAICDLRLGKGVVRAKDTPNFIANRVGTYSMLNVLRQMHALNMTIEEVDACTGPAIGQPKSATFRTADIVGIDVLAHVVRNLYENVSNDESREMYRLPSFVEELVERGWLGEKSGQGFYKRVKKGGDSEILTLDLRTMDYRPRQKARFASIDAGKQMEDTRARLRMFVGPVLEGKSGDKASQFFWGSLSGSCLYAARRVPEIADTIEDVDRAMRWGFAWELGPFEIWDAVGVERMARALEKQAIALPPLVEKVLDSPKKTFYEWEKGTKRYFDIVSGAHKNVEETTGIILLKSRKDRSTVVQQNAGASLIDLGDGVVCCEFHSKMNSIGADLVAMIQDGLNRLRSDFDAMVIGNQAPNFSVGANLMLLLISAQEGEWDDIHLAVRRFQRINMAIKYAPRPVVVAPQGMTLGGGCEISLHGARIHSTAEAYIGLVETGVGLIPGGGGTKEMLIRANEHAAAAGEDLDLFHALKPIFENIAMAKVSTSGEEARSLGFLRASDLISMNRDRQIADAKQTALGISRFGYHPPQPAEIKVLGEEFLAAAKLAIHTLIRGEFATEHDGVVARKLAWILAGGNLTAPQTVSEPYLLELEREAFLSLCGERKTQERIAHTLKTGKPLRN
jgi:3-hydroxyacyl-CoA dehydrogenase